MWLSQQFSTLTFMAPGDVTYDDTNTSNVLVIPGVPGIFDRVETGEWAYPDSTDDVIKLLREVGLTVDYSVPRSERVQVSHNAADFWLPVLLFVQQTSWDAIVSYVTNVLTILIGPLDVSNRRLHVKVGTKYPDGTDQYFEGSGKAKDVLAAMRQAGIDGP
jgi:hypothetical protein